MPSPTTPLLRPKPSQTRTSSSLALLQMPNQSHTPTTNLDALLRDITLGFSDGLTVPFALTASLSISGSTKIVIMGGLAELFSGMISMGLGAYNVAITEKGHWEVEYQRTLEGVRDDPETERRGVVEVLGRFGVGEESDAMRKVVREIMADEETWVEFAMEVGRGLVRPEEGRAVVSAVTMGVSYFVGGLVPMLPYFFMAGRAREALGVSVGIAVVVLLAFGFAKSWVTVRNKKAGVWGALQTLVIGAVAAGTSYGVVRLVDGIE
ncbi:Ccc1 family [Podospora aff. communis PSN243]|uniref:Ccc1 family n=1 Tax=Podospora aff. communis PSN243 TaxID=3040156 RepID=A0AAV9GGV3_9PEZI|nr:Ccc1 family [Podospora aff. communis PSN243]